MSCDIPAQLLIINYTLLILKSGRQDSNLRPPAPKAGAMNRATLRPELLIKLNPDENRDGKEQICYIFLKKSIKYILYLLKKQCI
jgi:hypothetical protein